MTAASPMMNVSFWYCAQLHRVFVTVRRRSRAHPTTPESFHGQLRRSFFGSDPTRKNLRDSRLGRRTFSHRHRHKECASCRISAPCKTLVPFTWGACFGKDPLKAAVLPSRLFHPIRRWHLLC